MRGKLERAGCFGIVQTQGGAGRGRSDSVRRATSVSWALGSPLHQWRPLLCINPWPRDVASSTNCRRPPARTDGPQTRPAQAQSPSGNLMKRPVCVCLSVCLRMSVYVSFHPLISLYLSPYDTIFVYLSLSRSLYVCLSLCFFFLSVRLSRFFGSSSCVYLLFCLPLYACVCLCGGSPQRGNLFRRWVRGQEETETDRGRETETYEDIRRQTAFGAGTNTQTL